MSRAHGSPALVLGTGVSGLSCAWRLAQAGFDVVAWDRRDVAHEVSSVAAAIWNPYLAGPPERVARWSVAALREFERLAREEGSGVTLREGVQLFPAEGLAPAYLCDLPGARELDPRELPPARARGFEFRVPVVDMGTYLPWLRAGCARLGVRFERREAATLGAALDRCALVVNCTGLASRELAADRALVPIRGQVVRVAAGATERFLIDEHGDDGLCYVVPRGRDIVLGGSADEGRTDLTEDVEQTRAIRARAAARIPALAEARVLEVKVGLRPFRPAVRVEAEVPRAGRLLVHDYGHGGAGVTLSWGCADEVLEHALRAPSLFARA